MNDRPCLCGPFERHVLATIVHYPPVYSLAPDGSLERQPSAQEVKAFEALAEARRQCERHGKTGDSHA